MFCTGDAHLQLLTLQKGYLGTTVFSEQNNYQQSQCSVFQILPVKYAFF